MFNEGWVRCLESHADWSGMNRSWALLAWYEKRKEEGREGT
jgi:hypothetical protein